MLKKLLNEAYFTLRITTTGPLLIKSGYVTTSGPDMTPVLTSRNGQQEPFLPGSSLKGVFRSHLEKIVCTIKPRVVCYPFWGNESQEGDLAELRQRDYRDSCSERFVKRTRDEKERKRLEERTDEVYADCCPICRLFGSTGFIGRVAIGDAYLASKKVITEQRDGVGIDRLTGGASHGAKFELEVISPGAVFETDIHLRNFERWQLGMLFVVVQDMEDELIRIGSGRSRGLGKVKAEISLQEKDGRAGVTTSVIRGCEESIGREPTDQLWGLGRWLNNGSYGTSADDWLPLKPPVERTDHGIRTIRVFTGEALTSLRNAAIDKFLNDMEKWTAEPAPTGQTRARR